MTSKPYSSITFKNASMSPTAGIKSGINGFNLYSNSIVCGVYLGLKKNTLNIVNAETNFGKREYQQ